MIVQRRKEGEEKWEIIRCGLTLGMLEPGYEYRSNQLIGPAVQKWPQTTMSEAELAHHLMWLGMTMPGTPVLRPVADAAIRHAIESGQVVPIEVHNQSILDSAVLEQNLRDQILRLTFPLMPSGVNVKFSMPTPKPTVYVKSFKQGEIVGRDMQIAINVRAACYAKLPGQVSNEELKTLIDLAK